MKKMLLLLTAFCTYGTMCYAQSELDTFPIFNNDKRPHSVFIAFKSKEVSYILQPGVEIITKAHQDDITVYSLKGSALKELLVIPTATRVEVIGHDFNGDGKKELVIAYHTEIVEGEVYIFSASPEFEQIGYSNRMQDKAWLSKNTLIMPFGSQGLYNELQYKNGAFVEVEGE